MKNTPNSKLNRKPNKKPNSKPNKDSKPFKIAARNLFLTYPKCDLAMEEVLKQFKLKFSTQIIKEYLITKETAKEKGDGKEAGEIHIHAYIRLTKVYSTYSPTALGLKGNQGEMIQGDYQVARKPNSVI